MNYVKWAVGSIKWTKNGQIMYNIVCACVQETNSSYFSSQVKNKPYKPIGAMRLFLRKVQSRTPTSLCPLAFYP